MMKRGRPPIIRDCIHEILSHAEGPVSLAQLATLVYGETTDTQLSWNRRNTISTTISKMRQVGWVINNPELPREGYHGRRNEGYTLVSAPEKVSAA